MTRQDELVSRIRGRSFPPPEDVSDGVFAREWLVRVRQEIPDDLVGEMTSRIVRHVQESMDATFARSATMALELVKISHMHVVARIAAPKHGVVSFDAAAFITWHSLRELDRLVGIEDLQGLPKEHWFELAPV